MPRTSGDYTRPALYGAVSGASSRGEQHNPPSEGTASALTDSLPRGETGPVTGTIAVGVNKITNLSNRMVITDVANFRTSRGGVS